MLWHSFNWLTRLVIVLSATFAVLLACVIIALRYWILPDIERYHDYITATMSRSVGNPVTIGKIAGDWQGIMPYLKFSDVQFLDDQHQVALMLKRVQGSISWMSLLTAQLRLANLEFDRPELLVRRDASGNMFVGGVKFSRTGDSNDLSDVLLRQSRVVVRDATIVWVDDFRKAPALVLQNVNLRIESLFNHHRFALRAIPPPELASPLDVRGDFHGSSLDDMSDWKGTIYTQLDFTDLKAWQSWLDMPRLFGLGRGALRGWLDIEAGKFAGISADVTLHDVVVKLGDDVPEMEMVNLNGRAAWHKLHDGFEVSTKGMALRLKNGIELPSTDLFFRKVIATDGQAAEGEVRANLLQLEKIAGLTKYLPLEPDIREQLNAYEPKGKVSNLEAQWQGSPDKPSEYKIDGHFENLAINQVGKMPGFSGLTFNVDGNESGGRINIKSRQMVVDAPGIMREPLSFATLIGQAGWKREHGELSINVDNIAVANDDLAGNLFGSYQTKAGTRGILNLTGRLTRGDIKRAARYTPLIALSKNGNDWLHGALQAGHTEDFRIRIKGNLSDFPLDGTKDVLFEIEGHARDAVLEFDKSWPSIEKITGEFLIRGNKLEVRSPSAIMAGARLQNVTVTLPDMMSKDLSLVINGEALASSNTFLDFIQTSPVRGYIDGFTDGMHASGNGLLDLNLRLPLEGDNPVKVAGTVKVQDNEIDLGKGVPLLRKTHGALTFTESGMNATGVSAEILGGPASINVQTAKGGAVHAAIKGHIDADVLRKEQPMAVLDHLKGSTAWDADISVVNKTARVVVNSNLQGMASSLPRPLSKTADEAVALHVEINPVMIPPKQTVRAKPCPEPCPQPEATVAKGQDAIIAKLGDIFTARLSRREENGVMAIKRGLVNFGADDKFSATKQMQRILRTHDGVWLVGSLPEVSMQGWEDLAGGGDSSAPAMTIAGINLHIDKLTGYDQNISALQIDASQRGDGLAVELSSSALDGEIVWEPHGYESGSMVRARLNNLQWSGEKPSEQESLPAEPPLVALPEKPEPDVMKSKSQMVPGHLPAFDVRIEKLEYKAKQIGHFELVGHPEDNDWRLRRLNIVNPDGSLVGDGVWSDGDAEKTQVNLTLDISDAGKILGRSGYPNTVKGGNGKLVANLSWAGAPADFSADRLNGTLKLDAGKGRFLKMDPGAGKLLSILSLQALPQHIKLDFNDVFSAGFQFDSINGNASIKDGVIDTQDFHIDGSAAKVTLNGKVDMNRETQDLKVKVLPTIGDSMSLIGAIAISPVVGIGALIANKVLGNPLDKLVAFEYNVSGKWSDPDVVKVGAFKSNQIQNPNVNN